MDARLLEKSARFVGVLLRGSLVQVIKLVLSEAGDEGTLMLLEDKLGYELADTLYIKKLYYVNFVRELL